MEDETELRNKAYPDGFENGSRQNTKKIVKHEIFS